MSDSRIGPAAWVDIEPLLTEAVTSLANRQQSLRDAEQRKGDLVERVGDILSRTPRGERTPPAEAAAGPVEEATEDKSGEKTWIVFDEDTDWRSRISELVVCLRGHGYDGMANTIVRHVPCVPKPDEREYEKRDRGELAVYREREADEANAVKWLLCYLRALAPVETAASLASEGGAAESEPAAVSPQLRAPLPEPEKQLSTWRDILIALGIQNNDEDRQKVDRLNSTYAGPIVKPGQGMQPFANKRKLLEWWNGLEETVQAQADRARDVKETVKATYAYGREGEVVPEISGEVKKRRKDRQP